jgi:hypothetical protein
MFQLSQNHMNAFERVSMANFEMRGGAYLRKTLPRQTAPYTDEQLRRRVGSGADRARAYGLYSEQQIMRFVETGFRLGEWFDSDPQHRWSQQVLRDSTVSADHRAALLVGIAFGLSEPNAGGTLNV